MGDPLMLDAQPSVSRTLPLLPRLHPTDKSVGYFHSSASPTFAASPPTLRWLKIDFQFRIALRVLKTASPQCIQFCVRSPFVRIRRALTQRDGAPSTTNRLPEVLERL